MYKKIIWGVMLVGIFIAENAFADWRAWNAWSYRKEVTIDNTANSNSLTDYQVLVTLKPDFNYNHANNDGSDVRFANISGNALSYWIATWTTTGTSTIWVKVDSIPASSSATIYMYYGNPSATTTTANFDNTFTKDFGESGLVGLWHMDEGSGTTVYDSSGNGNTGTTHNFVSPNGWVGTDGGQWDGRSDVNFATGSCLSFDGGNDYVEITENTDLDPHTSSWTIEAWVNITTLQNYIFWNSTNYGFVIVGKWHSHPYDGNQSLSLMYKDGTSTNSQAKAAISWDANSQTGGAETGWVDPFVWHHLVGVRDGGNCYIYFDGIPYGPNNFDNPPPASQDINSSTPIHFGHQGAWGHYGNGVIDEVRIYNRALSPDEIKAHYERRKYSDPEPITAIGEETHKARITLVSPLSGPVGTIVTVEGDGYGATELIRIDFGTTKTITLTTTNATGQFITTFTVDYQSPGIVTVTALGLISTAQTNATFSVTHSNNPELTVRLDQIDPAKFPTIECYVQVLDLTHSISGLTVDNFQLTEQSNLEPIPTIETISVSGTITSGVDIALVIDRSGSMGGQKITDAKQAANSLVDMMEALDRMAVVSFSSSVSIDQPFTSNQSALHSAINNLSASGNTALYDGIYTGINQCTQEIGVKAVIALTDGLNNTGSHNQQDVINYANASGVPVYTIGLGNDVDTNVLQNIATSTGGTYHFTPNSSDLEDIFNDIRREIETQYLVTYITHNPNYDGTTRTVVVTVNYNSKTGSDSGTYQVDEPLHITRTEETIALGSQSQPSGQALTIAATITDNTQVTSARLFYRQSNSGNSYTQLSMNKVTGDLYQATIPSTNVNFPGVDYYITASDGILVVSDPKNNPETSPYQIVVYPNERPVITHTPVSGALINSTITITAYATDTTNYLVQVTLFYRTKGYVLYDRVNMSNVGSTYTGTIPANKMTSAGVEYYIVAEDNYGIRGYHGSDVNPHYIRPNAQPAIIITSPPAGVVFATNSYIVRWIDTDQDDNAQISLYYDIDNTGYDGRLILSGISEDDETDNYLWDISGIPEGSYYVYGKIDDGTNTPVYDYSDGLLTIDRTPPTATITTSPASPITVAGVVYATLTASEKLKSASLNYTPYGKSPISISLNTTDNIIWSGSFNVNAYTGDGRATFTYTLTDLAGNIGSGTKEFEIDVSYVVFDPATYTFNVDRNYDQQRLVYVHNIDNESHTIEVGVINSYTDLIVGFIGDAQPGNSITLEPGESRALILNIHAQDALYEDYDIQTTITTSAVSHSLNYANIHIDVRQPNINLVVTFISENPYTLAKKYRITNYGEPITDLHVYLGTDTLQGKVLLQPQINHGNIGTNESIDITLTPIITEAGWTGANGYFYVDGVETYMGAQVHVETYVNWTLPPGYAVYLITLNDPKLFFDLHDWYCVNVPEFYSGFYLPYGFGSQDVKTATLRFTHTGLNPIDEMKIYLNNNQLTSGYRISSLVTFQIPAEYFNYPAQGEGAGWNGIKGTIKHHLVFIRLQEI